MKKLLLLTSLVGLGLVAGANASDFRDTTINLYGVGAKIDANQDATAGAGLMLDSEDFKFKIEGTSDFIKTGAVLKVNPFNENLYFKFGLNYLNQRIYAPDNTSARVNQYSGAFGTGYMIQDDFYIEIGGSHTNLNGTVFGDYQMLDEKTSLAYVEMAKRWESGLGTIDTTANAGKVFHEFIDNKNSFGFGIDYYPMDNAKLAYSYQYEENNIVNNYKAQYSFVFVEFNDNISNDTYNVRAGFAIAFDDIFDISTYKAPTNIKSHLSELHRFESVAFGTNMNIQSSQGVKMTDEAIAEANAPTIAMANQSVNDGGGAGSVDLPAPTVTKVVSGAVYSIVSDPTGGKLTINANTGIATWDGDLGSNTDYSITIKVVNPDGGTSSTTFTLTVIDNL